MAETQDGKQKVRHAGMGTVVYGKCFGVVQITGVIEILYLSFLVRESGMHAQGGMEGVCRVVVGCTQPDGWKITSANPIGDWFIEWRWFLRELG